MYIETMEIVDSILDDTETTEFNEVERLIYTDSIHCFDSLEENNETNIELCFSFTKTDINYERMSSENKKHDEVLLSIKKAIVKELHLAMCEGDKKYKQYIQDLQSNIKMFIAVIAGSVASSFGILKVAITGLVAVFIAFFLRLGKETVCKLWKEVKESG